MVRKWGALGVIVQAPGVEERILIETGRPKFDGLKDREYFYMMMNIESYPDLVPYSKTLATKFLDAARELQKTAQFKSDPDLNIYEFFEYSPSGFEARLQQIYERLSAACRSY